MPDPIQSNYTSNEVRVRIFIYVALAVFATLGANVMNLAAMSDQQLAAITPLRWTLTILLALFAAIGAGLTAFRAAIDRSTAGGNSTTPNADPTPSPSSLPMKSTPLIFALCAVALSLSACAGNSPFVAKSESQPGDGKIPVAVTASATASGSTASNDPTDYTGGVAVTFGKNTPPSVRQAFFRKLGIKDPAATTTGTLRNP